MLPDLSISIKTLAGTSPTPVPGGKGFDSATPINKKIKKMLFIKKDFKYI